MGECGDGEDAEELTCSILQQADSGEFAPTLKAGAKGCVRVGCDGNGRDTDDGADIGRVRRVVDCQISLLLPCERERNLVVEKALIGINEFAARRRWLIHL